MLPAVTATSSSDAMMTTGATLPRRGLVKGRENIQGTLEMPWFC
jgi:hypothetical protein